MADLRSLGAAEIAHRAWFSVARRTNLLRRRFPPGYPTAGEVRRALGPAHRQVSAESWLDHLQSRPVPAFLFAPADRPAFAERLSRFPEAVLRRADRLAAGGILLFGEVVDLPQPLDWHRDPFSGYSWPRDCHWTELTHSAPEGTDVRAVWEISRQRDLFVLGRAYWRTSDERYAAAAATRIRAWLAANPPETGINWWSNLEIAIRSIAWVAALHWFVGSRAFDPHLVWDVTTVLIASGRHMERHLAYTRACMPGNHVVGDAAGLAVIAFALPEVEDAHRWRNIALGVLRHEARAQTTASGAHVEEAPGYHLFVCELFYLVARLAERNGVAVPEIWDVVHRMVETAALMARPDRTLPACGDADESSAFDLGEGPRVEALAALAAVRFHRGDLKSVVREIPESMLWLEGPGVLDRWSPIEPAPAPLVSWNAIGGFARADWSSSTDYWFLRGGSLTRHTHADALHLEIVVGGRPVIVDAGTGSYNASAGARDYFRGTFAHSTLAIDGLQQATPHRTFRWADTFAVRWHGCQAAGRGVLMDAEHDAYGRLGIRHRRQVLWIDGLGWLVIDRLAGTGSHAVDLRWVCDGTVRMQDAGADVLQEQRPVLALRSAPRPKAIRIERGEVAPWRGWLSRRYAHMEPAPVIVSAFRISAPCVLATCLRPRPGPQEAFLLDATHDGDSILVQIEMNQERWAVRVTSEMTWEARVERGECES